VQWPPTGRPCGSQRPSAGSGRDRLRFDETLGEPQASLSFQHTRTFKAARVLELKAAPPEGGHVIAFACQHERYTAWPAVLVFHGPGGRGTLRPRSRYRVQGALRSRVLPSPGCERVPGPSTHARPGRAPVVSRHGSGLGQTLGFQGER